MWGNIDGKPILDFSQPLTGDQLAPFGFLIAQRALVTALGASRYVARLIPLASGIVALGLFSVLARRILPRRAALVALVLFAFSDDLIYYSSEMKPYSLDLAVGLAVTLAALAAVGNRRLRTCRVAVMAIAAVLAPWCSFPSAFVVAGCGATLILTSLLRGAVPRCRPLARDRVGWLASFVRRLSAVRWPCSARTRRCIASGDFAFLPVCVR